MDIKFEKYDFHSDDEVFRGVEDFEVVSDETTYDFDEEDYDYESQTTRFVSHID